jgi:hypothetical protein
MKIGPFVLALSALALSSCGGSSSSAPPQHNPASTTVLWLTPAGAPATSLPVTLSTGIAGGNTPTGVIKTSTTDSTGNVTFNGLPSSGNVCVSATYGSGQSALFKGDCFFPFPTTLTLQFQAPN